MLEKTFNIKQISIEKLYLLNEKFTKQKGDGEKDIIDCKVEVLNNDGENPVFEKPNSIIRHKTNKEKWEVKSTNKKVIVTEDHSVIIRTNTSDIEVKPCDINNHLGVDNKGDLVKLNSKHIGNFNDEYVYDIEMSNNHTFYANDLLVHNTDSNYISLEELISDLESNHLLPEKYKNNIPQFYLDIDAFRLQDFIKQAYDQFASKLSSPNKQKFELEAAMYNTIFLAKKKYIGDLSYKEGAGILPRNKKLKITGVEIIQSSTPKFAREELKKLLNFIFDTIDNFNMMNFLNEMNKIKLQFKEQHIDNISYSRSIGDYEKFILDDKNNFVIGSKCPIHVRGAGYHNHLVYNSKVKDKYIKLKTSDKVKYYHTNDETCNVFAYAAGNYPYEVAPAIDIDEQFFKCIIEPMNRFIDALDHQAVGKDMTSILALF